MGQLVLNIVRPHAQDFIQNCASHGTESVPGHFILADIHAPQRRQYGVFTHGAFAGASARENIAPLSGQRVQFFEDFHSLPGQWFDKNLLYDMSYALMRRFAFIEVGTPDEATYMELLGGDGNLVQHLLPLRRFVDLGPAVFLDAARYVERRRLDNVSRSRVLYEAFYAYFLPQLDGLDDLAGSDLYRTVSEHLDDPERAEVRRCLNGLLGTSLVA